MNQEQVKTVKDHIHEKYGYAPNVATALNMLDAVIATLDGLGADYTVYDKLSLIYIDVEPRISYDSRLFEIDVTDATMQVLTREEALRE